MSGKEKDQNDSESTSEDQDLSQEESQEMTETNSQQDGPDSEEEITIQAAEDAEDFTDPMLKGKSPEEIERLWQVSQDAIKSQNRELNEMHEKVSAQPSAPAPGETQPEEEDADYGDDFMGPRFQTLERRLTKKLEEMVSPLEQEFKKQGTGTVRDEMRREHEHFDVLEPHIDDLLRRQGTNPQTANKQQLETIYHTAVGYAVSQGIDLTGGAKKAPEPKREEKKVNIPQHRPSSAPLPSPQAGEKKRQLTEEEKRLAKEFFGSEQDPEGAYREWQDKDEGDVVNPGFSKEGW